jgi:hypothetical protein
MDNSELHPSSKSLSQYYVALLLQLFIISFRDCHCRKFVIASSNMLAMMITGLAFLIVLSTLPTFSTSFALKTSHSRVLERKTSLFSTTNKLTTTAAEADLAYEYWMDDMKGIPETAPAYLSREQLTGKFDNLVKTVNSVEGALAMLKNDASVLKFQEERISESYAAWCRRLEGDDAKALELCIRAPMILALKAKVVGTSLSLVFIVTINVIVITVTIIITAADIEDDETKAFELYIRAFMILSLKEKLLYLPD